MKIEDNDWINEIYLKVTIQDLEEENKNLKEELSKYKHYYDRDKEELMESCYALKKENDELKKKRKKEEIRVARDEHSYDEIWGE